MPAVGALVRCTDGSFTNWPPVTAFTWLNCWLPTQPSPDRCAIAYPPAERM
jgi:hypothetical protein